MQATVSVWFGVCDIILAGEERNVQVNLTHHLFEAMGCKAFGKVVAEDLMTGTKNELNFSADKPVEIVLKPYQVCVYRINN